MQDPRQGIVPFTLAMWQTYAHQSPMSLFITISLIADETTKQTIEHYCVDQGYIAGIDYVSEPGVACYVWRRLVERATGRHWQYPITSLIRQAPPRQLSTEQLLIPKIIHVLESHNIAVDTEFKCATGIADIVTKQRDIIYEVKGHLSRMALFQAVGQVLLYRASINPAARVGIIGYPTSDTAVLQPAIESLGIRVILWKDSNK